MLLVLPKGSLPYFVRNTGNKVTEEKFAGNQLLVTQLPTHIDPLQFDRLRSDGCVPVSGFIFASTLKYGDFIDENTMFCVWRS